MDLLRKNGAKSGAEDSIHIAAVMGNIGAIERHLNTGVNVNAKDKFDRTPLDLAISRKHTQIADLLRKHGGKTGEELKAEGK